MNTGNAFNSSVAALDKTVEIISDSVAPVVNPVLDSLKQEGEQLVTQTWRQLLTPELIPVNEGPVSQGDLQEGEFLTLGGKRQEGEPQNLPAMNYSKEFNQEIEVVRQRGEHQTQTRVQEIIVELAQAGNSSTEAASELKNINLTLEPVNTGKYQLGFFERVLSLVRRAQTTAEDGANWIIATGNKNARKTYEGFSRKGTNTKWLLSGERTAATSSVG